MAKKALIHAIVLTTIVSVIVGILFIDGFWQRLVLDFWPPDSSRVGPNLLASIIQWLVVVFIAVVIYPPLRKWVERELDHIHTKLDHAINTNPNVEDLPDDAVGRPWSIHNEGEPKP